jgi:small subunit ribosomal protein S8
MLSALKNGMMAGNPFIETFYSKECEGVAKVLEENGFLDEVKIFKEKGASHKKMKLVLTKEDDGFRLSDIRRISKPGRRLYSSSADLRLVAGGTGTLVVSTSRGIMSGKEAKGKKLGGELICEVR